MDQYFRMQDGFMIEAKYFRLKVAGPLKIVSKRGNIKVQLNAIDEIYLTDEAFQILPPYY